MASRPLIDVPSNVANFPSKNEAYASGVSWAAVFGGAAVAAALSLILLALGAGLGLASVSPWSNVGASAVTVTGAAVVWLILMQIISSSMGGYLAGRLRTKWTAVHTDEVYFRDTAHGFLVWAVGLVFTAAFLASAATSMLGGNPQITPTGGETVNARATDDSQPGDYFVDKLLRSDHPNVEGSGDALRGEVARIFSTALAEKEISPADQSYLAQLVASRTGITPAEANSRVSGVLQEARQTADKARKAAAHLSIWVFIALLTGAFFASYAATIGGRQRDRTKDVHGV